MTTKFSCYFFALVLLLCATFAHSQGARWDLGAPGSAGAVTLSGNALFAVPGVQLAWCNFPANAVPCTNYATTYTSLTLQTPCPSNTQVVLQGSTTCQATGDNFGNLGIYTANGTYQYTLTVGGVSLGPYTATVMGSGFITNPGVFTNTQMNEYLLSQIGGISNSALFAASQGGAQFATEAISGGVAMPLGATVHNGNGIGGYASSVCNSFTRSVCNAVGVYGMAIDVAGGNGAGLWGGNFLCQMIGASAINTNCTGVETDINTLGAANPFFVIGNFITGAGTGSLPPAFAPGAGTGGNNSAAMAVAAPRLAADANYIWPLGLNFFRASVSPTAIQIDGTCNGIGVTTCGSAQITFTGYNANVQHTASILGDLAGDLVLTPAAGQTVNWGEGTFGSRQQSGPTGCELNFGTTTLNTAGTTTNTGQNCLPLNAVIDAVEYFITSTITTAANFTIGDGSTANRFCTTQSTLTAGTSGTCLAHSGTSAQVQGAAAPVRVTTNVNPGAGAIRLVVYYHNWGSLTH